MPKDVLRISGRGTITLRDLGGVLVLTPQHSEIDALADQVAGQWAADGQTLERMLRDLREERGRFE